MDTLLMVLGVAGYVLALVITKAYIKTYRWSYLSDEVDAYILGVFWPIYFMYRLISWPLSNASRFIESKMEEVKQTLEAKEAKQQAKLRVPVQIDSEYREAEQEVEHFLTQEKERHHSL